MRRFTRFACIDWSGAKGERLKGIAVGHCAAGGAAPALVEGPLAGGRWSRAAVLGWLRAQADEDMLIGVDFSTALPFDPVTGYLGDVAGVPRTARAFWAWLDHLCAQDDHLGVASFLAHPGIAAHFRIGAVTGLHFPSPREDERNGRLRAVERCRESGMPASCFNLVGARQVGRSSLTGMRVLHRLAGAVPVWPFDAEPQAGALIVEIYTSIAAVAAGRRLGATKMTRWEALDDALAALGSKRTDRTGPIDDHRSDALLTAAWLRRTAADAALWRRPPLAIAQTEGWTFGVPYRTEAPEPA